MRAQDLRYAVVEISPDRTRVTVPAVHTGVLVADRRAARGARRHRGARHGHRHPDRHRARLHLLPPHPRPRPRRPRRAGGPARRRAAAHHARPDRARPAAPAARPRGPDHRAQLRQPARATASTRAGWSASSSRRCPRPSATSSCPWLDAAVTFPNGMVDRIVPATTDAYRAAAAAHLGVTDAIPVPAEPFTMWVLEDRFAAGRPAWEHGGAALHRRRRALRAAQAPAAQRHPLADRLPRRPGRPRHHPGGRARSPSSPTPPAGCCSTSTCPR